MKAATELAAVAEAQLAPASTSGARQGQRGSQAAVQGAAGPAAQQRTGYGVRAAGSRGAAGASGAPAVAAGAA